MRIFVDWMVLLVGYLIRVLIRFGYFRLGYLGWNIMETVGNFNNLFQNSKLTILFKFKLLIWRINLGIFMYET